MIPKLAGTLFALIMWAKFGPVVTPRVKKLQIKVAWLTQGIGLGQLLRAISLGATDLAMVGVGQ